ncbi:MAG: hypothetical protein ACEY3D_01845 [Rickettsia sp.]|uniref:hypothetical protein n=1 Tax=Rickettsia sp. TaxID=789 RepID=UPI00397B4888
MSFPRRRESRVKRDKSSFSKNILKSFKIMDSRLRGNDIETIFSTYTALYIPYSIL